MTIYYINTGTSPNAGNGDSLRTAFTKINTNFGTLVEQIAGGTASTLVAGTYTFALSSTGTVSLNGEPFVSGSSSAVASDIAPTSPSLGDLWYDTVAGQLFVYYDSGWIDASPNTTGPQGEAGPTGPQGNQGPAGADSTVPGPTGPNGAPIYEGTSPPQDANSLWYDTTGGRLYIYYDNSWVDASPTTVGPPGLTGPSGANGSEGPSGPSGANGVDGPQGPQGEPGFEGPTGPSGANGVDGPQGPQGEPGVEGPTGPSGANGSEGPTGAQGEPGVEGPTGPSGANGSEGPTGAQGEPGFEGPTGPSGANGVDGPQGPQGVTGVQGPTGPVGSLSATGSIIGTLTNVTLIAGSYSYVFDNTGTFTMPVNGDIMMPGANVSWSVLGVSPPTFNVSSTGTKLLLWPAVSPTMVDYAVGIEPNALWSSIPNTTGNFNFKWYAGTTTIATLSNTGTITTNNFIGDGSQLTGVAVKTTGAWTVPVGTNTYSITVPTSGTYQIWVRGNIPNGIIAYNATAVVTNSNVPVVGDQYAWVYNGGGTPIDFTSIPNQFIGTGGTIVRSSVAPSATTNRFDFGINNSSTSSQIVYWGYVTL